MADQDKPIAYIASMGAGLEAFIYREIETLYAGGKRIVIYATKFKRNDIFSPREDWPYEYISLPRLALAMPRLLLKMLLRPMLLLEALRDGGLVDLIFATRFAPSMQARGIGQIHCHFGDHKFFIGYYCKRITGLPLSVTIHAHEFYTNPNPALFRKALAGADRIFPIARRWCDLLQHDYGVPKEKIRLNRLFVDTDLYKPVSEIRVLAVGRFTERKGFHYLMQAAGQLKDLELRFMFVGFGDLDLREMAKSLGVAERVTVFGKMDQEQLRSIYQMADILCVPSITTEKEGAEGIPVVLMEGMACGLPVVATRCGAIDEIVEEILVDESSPEQLAEGIRALAINEELRRRQGERNRRMVEERYGIGNVHQFGRWLDELADAKSHVGP
jgi:glycosyltransferase involved in cell wall biosynthesis